LLEREVEVCDRRTNSVGSVGNARVATPPLLPPPLGELTLQPESSRHLARESSSPNLKNKSHTITVDVEITTDGADGLLVAAGGNVGGYAHFIKDGKPM
jgi:arylsulfatase